MSGYPYGNPQYPPPAGYPQYPPMQNQIYPQIHPQAFGAPPLNPGFQYPSAPTQPPAAMSYPQGGELPTVTPTTVYPGFPTQPAQPVEWIPCSDYTAEAQAQRAVVAGYEGHDNSPLWVIRAFHEGDLIPGKLAIKHKTAYVPWGGNEIRVHNFEVCVAAPERVRWLPSNGGNTPPNAIHGGRTSSGENLFIGRARQDKSLTPGKIHPSHNVMYISYAGKEIPHSTYEVLCAFSPPSQIITHIYYPSVSAVPTVKLTPLCHGVTPRQPDPAQAVEWIKCTEHSAESHAHRAVVAGYEGHDYSPLWVIRAYHNGDLIPGKLAIKYKTAYVPWDGKEIRVHNFEVCVTDPEKIRWVSSNNGATPPKAIYGGNTSAGETLFIGRAKQEKSFTPGKIHPSHRAMYVSYAGKEITHKIYEVLCAV